MFKVVLEKRAAKIFNNFNQKIKKIILRKIKLLSLHPLPLGKNIKQLKNVDVFRLRVGNYRILYRINNDIIEIYAIGHRKDIYRKLLLN